MYRQVLFTIVFFLAVKTSLSIRCYTGADSQCMVAPDMRNCGSGDSCVCAKYRFKCFPGDFACSQQEQMAGSTKWAYLVVAKSLCNKLQSPSSGVYDVTCCSMNRCNLPIDLKCTWSYGHQRSLRKHSDLLNVQ